MMEWKLVIDIEFGSNISGYSTSFIDIQYHWGDNILTNEFNIYHPDYVSLVVL